MYSYTSGWGACLGQQKITARPQITTVKGPVRTVGCAQARSQICIPGHGGAGGDWAIKNLTADIEFARVELSLAANAANTPDEIKVSRLCKSMLQKCFDNNRQVFKNTIFVRQTLFQIMQQLIIFTPRENLKPIWLALKQRLEAAGKADRDYFMKTGTVARIERFLKSDTQNAEVEAEIRRLIKRVRSFLDELTMIELWKVYSLQVTNKVCVAFGCALIILIPLAYIFENGCSSEIPWYFQFSGCVRPENHGIVLTCLCGAVGGAISMLFPSSSGSNDRALQLVQISVVRPILGGLAGLFLFFVADPGLVTLKYPSLYAMAIAIGFSERAFVRMLSSNADRLGNSLTRAIGQLGNKETKQLG